jgi:ADP-heptose:LPS heptosyltransferase
MSDALVIQLARLGDLIQTAPVLAALAEAEPAGHVDLLCAAPFEPLGRCLPGVRRVLPWDGPRWRQLAGEWAMAAAEEELRLLIPHRYPRAYNLNQHARARVIAHLSADHVVGPGDEGPLTGRLPPWAAYLESVAHERGNNRIHLSDTWIGLCGLAPARERPALRPPPAPLARDLEEFLAGGGLRIAMVVGAGDPVRVLPVEARALLADRVLGRDPYARIVLIGGRGEEEAGLGIERRLMPGSAARVWNAIGRTDLLQLARVLAGCTWVMGPDTGPFHLGTLVGARGIGFYIARARVHETGPYGTGHYVWQQEAFDVRRSKFEDTDHMNVEPRSSILERSSARPEEWPIDETVELVVTGRCAARPAGWSLWQSRLDEFGVFYHEASREPRPDPSRKAVWEQLQQSTQGLRRTCPTALAAKEAG